MGVYALLSLSACRVLRTRTNPCSMRTNHIDRQVYGSNHSDSPENQIPAAPVSRPPRPQTRNVSTISHVPLIAQRQTSAPVRMGRSKVIHAVSNRNYAQASSRTNIYRALLGGSDPPSKAAYR